MQHDRDSLPTVQWIVLDSYTLQQELFDSMYITPFKILTVVSCPYQIGLYIINRERGSSQTHIAIVTNTLYLSLVRRRACAKLTQPSPPRAARRL